MTSEADLDRMVREAFKPGASSRPNPAPSVDEILDQAFGRRAGHGKAPGRPVTALELAEAQSELMLAATFGRPAAAWAVEVQRYAPLSESVGALTRSMTVQVRESAAAVATGGRLRVRVIAPGQGSSGFYSSEVLKKDGPSIFVAGVQCFLDHPSPYDRPERSVRALAGKLATAAVWEDRGPLGAGLYADVDIFPHAAALLDSIGSHIGVSVRGEGEIDAAGNVTALTAAHSVDFVTRAGAGGAVVA